MTLREIEVENAIRKFLGNEGYEIKPRLRSQGVDITAVKNGITLLVECEGNEKPSGLPLDDSQKYTHFFRMLGQVMKNYGNGQVAIGLPVDAYFQKKLKMTLKARKRLKVGTFSVSDNGQVRLLVE